MCSMFMVSLQGEIIQQGIFRTNKKISCLASLVRNKGETILYAKRRILCPAYGLLYAIDGHQRAVKRMLERVQIQMEMELSLRLCLQLVVCMQINEVHTARHA